MAVVVIPSDDTRAGENIDARGSDFWAGAADVVMIRRELRAAVIAAADAWERAQGGTEEVERLRAAVVAMRGET